jgi:hypothetical protein
MSYEVDRIEGDKCVAIVYADECAEDADPRQWDNLSIMRCSHRNYRLGDGEPEGRHVEALERGGLRLLERYLRIVEGAVAFVPLGLIDHSGLSLYAGGGSHWSDSAGWDSGTVGYAYVTRERCDELGAPIDSAERQMLGEIETYDQYLRGDVFYVVVEDDRGETLDSCGGFIGFDTATEHARETLDWCEPDVAEKRARENQYLAGNGCYGVPATAAHASMLADSVAV